MAEFLQKYGVWILLVGGMFLLHRLGVGCCGGHSPRHGRGHGEPAKAEPKPTDG